MLEEALKRGDAGMAGGSKDIGWRRWSAREGEKLASTLHTDEERPRSADYGVINGQPASGPHPNGLSITSIPSHSASPLSCSTVIPPTQAAGQDTRFFRGFRFSNGSGTTSGTSTPAGRSSRSPTRSPGASLSNLTGPLTSPSMSSLHSNSNQEILEMRQILDILQTRVSELEKELGGTKTALGKEREERQKASNEKITLEGEIESLSQALFEEVRILLSFCIVRTSKYHAQANKMVAQERIRRAETEYELREARLEKEALRSALRVLESENGRLRTSNYASASPIAKTLEGMQGDEDMEGRRRKAIDLDEEYEVEKRRRSAMDESRHVSAHAEVNGEPTSRSSSRLAMKSPISFSRASSESITNVLAEPALVLLPPSPTSSPSRSPSLSEYSTVAQSRSQTLPADEVETGSKFIHERSQLPLFAPPHSRSSSDEASP